jgi:hypothetical protein
MTKNLISRSPPCYGKHIKSLVPAVFTVVIAHPSALGLRGGLWPLWVSYKACLYPNSEDINRLMIMMMAKKVYICSLVSIVLLSLGLGSNIV